MDCLDHPYSRGSLHLLRVSGLATQREDAQKYQRHDLDDLGWDLTDRIICLGAPCC